MINDIISYLLILFTYCLHNTLGFSSLSSNLTNSVNKGLNFENKTFDEFYNTIIIDNMFENFVNTYRLPDGEIITKLKFSNYSAIETKYSDLCLRQITNGTDLIQLWFSNQQLLDCEFTTDTKSIHQLLKEFDKSNEQFLETQTDLSVSANSTALLTNWSHLIDYKHYRQQCHRLHKKVMKQFNSKEKRSELKRWKRADLLVFPGTNWCGKGSNSKSFEDLGDHSFADRCCRDHDYCKYTIGPFAWKYHLFNYRFHYVSHCSCDERFRSCLKVANTGAANLVGKLFFNVVQTKCFLFRTENVCSRRSWWGKCLNNKRKKRAFFRSGLKY